jgi:7-cyano-7-deazaguanine reductase
MPELVAMPNPTPGEAYRVRITTDEFTCLCPWSGQPDFATVEISYEPDVTILELKSLKLYLQGYRDRGVTHEGAATAIYRDLQQALQPLRLDVRLHMNVRGGITTTVEVPPA